MVTITGYNIRQNKGGENFVALTLTGNVELIQSSSSGRFYATNRKVSMPSTFDEATAKMCIGQSMPGSIVRTACEPYSFTVKRTGEVMSLAYSWAYQPEGSKELLGQGFVEINEQQNHSTFQKANSSAIMAAANR